MKQQTAVERLVNEIMKHDKSFTEYYGAEIEQAKEMEKKQIIEAHGEEQFKYKLQDDGSWKIQTAEQYYNKTFGK